MFNKRNWLMLALCLVLMAGLMLPGVPAACAESSGTCGAEGDNLRWSLDRNRVLTISGTGAMADYVSSVDEGEHAPWGRDIRGVKIETGVTHVGDWAFFGCCSLTAITLPEGLESIGYGAFAGCPALRLTVPRDSYAAAYCERNGLNYLYPDSLDWLNG